MGPSTLSGLDNLVVSVVESERDSMTSFFKAETEEGGVGTPFCNPVEITYHSSLSNGSTADITIINFDAQYDAQKFSVCFTMADTFLIDDWFGVDIRLYDEATNLWVEEGIEDTQESDDETFTYCRWVSKTGLYAPFEASNENDARLYSGFILYVMFGIDIYLVILIIIGCKMDKKSSKQQRQPHGKSRTSVLNDKEYSGINTD